MSRPPIVWRRVSQGFYLMGFGVLLLLCTQGHLQWSFWHDAVSFWPVLLIGIGIRVVFEKTSVPWLVLASPVVVLGTLAVIAVHGPAEAVEPKEWERVRVERPEHAEQWTLVGRWHHARLDLRALDLDGTLLEGRRAPDDGASVRASGADDVRVRAGNRSPGPLLLLPRRRSPWELDLERSLPVELDLELVLTDGRADLTAAAVSRVDIEGALNDVTLRLGRPTEDVTVELSGAFSDLELVVPAEVPVKVRTDGPFNPVEGRASPPSGEGPGYLVYVNGAFNRVSVTAAEPLELERAH